MTFSDTPFTIGDCRVEPRLNHIVHERGRSEVEPKVMRVLLCLAARPGEVCSRDELLDEVWPDTVVTDHVLTRAISHLRQAFGDTVQAPRYIQTISKGGYRLIADVSAPSEEAYAGDGHARTMVDEAPVLARPAAPVRVVTVARWWGHPLAAAVLGAGVVALVIVGGWSQRPPAVGAVYPVVPLVSTQGLDYRPMLSPDGAFLVFSRPSQGGASDLFVKQIGTEQERQLTTHPGYDDYATWLPEGHEVAFQRIHEGECSLYAVAAMGGAERRLGPCTLSQRGLDASPDGKWFVVTDLETPEAPRSLYLVDAQTFERRRLTRPPVGDMDFDPHFSPDGQTVAFTRGLRHAGVSLIDIYTVAVTGERAPRRLTTDRGHVAGLTWTPSGESLIYSSNRRGPYRLWRVEAQGGVPLPLTGVQTFDPGNPSMARAAGRLAFEEWHFDFNIWAFDPATDTLTKRASSTRWDHEPGVAPGGEQVAFISNRRGETELWTAQPDGSEARPLTSQAPVSIPRWSSDGRMLTYGFASDGRAGISVINAEGGASHALDIEGDSFNPSWSRDGRYIYYSTTDSGRWQAWKAPIDGGAPQRVVEDGYVAREGPDGAVYYVQYLTPGLWKLRDDGTSEKVVEALAPGDWINWDITDEAVYYIARSSKGAALTRFDLESGETRQLHVFNPAQLGPLSGLSVAPDGLVFISLVDEHESDIHLVDSLVI